MTSRKAQFELNIKTAEKILSMLEIDYDTLETGATPTEICQEIGIDRRTFNSVVSKAIFTKRPTKAQKLLREHIMETIYTQCYLGQEKERTQ